MKKILVLFAHPRPDRSEVNVKLAEAASQLEHVTLVDLYATYPTFKIDVQREQARLLAHDIIIFQHPVYWYSSPAILKEWQDLVLEHGFAYGSKGKQLSGKLMVSAVTTGAAKSSYSRETGLHHELKDFFKPFEYTAKLCRMRYLPPFAIYHAGLAEEQGLVAFHTEEYRRLLVALGAECLDMKKADLLARLNDDLDGIIHKPEGAE